MNIPPNNISKIWSEIIQNMEGDDIVLEIRVADAGLHRHNALLEFLVIRNYQAKYFLADHESDLPAKIDQELFEEEDIKHVVVDLKSCTLDLYYNSMDEMEFYTSSALHLNAAEASPIFEFIHELGCFIQSKILLYIESYPKHSYIFDPER